MLHRSNGARRRRGGQKASFLCRSDGVLTDLCSLSWTFSSEWRLCAACSGSKWSVVWCGRVLAVGKDFYSSCWIEAGRSVKGFADRRVDMNDMPYGSPTTTTTSTLDRDKLGAALLFWNSSSDKGFCEQADRCLYLKRERGASERERERKSEFECVCVCVCVCVCEGEREREREREREKAVLSGQKKIVQRSSCRCWKKLTEFLENHWSTLWFPSSHWLYHEGEQICHVPFFYTLIKLVCVSGNEKIVKIMRQFFFFFANKTLEPSNTCTLDTHVHAHTCAMHAYVHIHTSTFVHAHTPKPGSCMHTHSHPLNS